MKRLFILMALWFAGTGLSHAAGFVQGKITDKISGEYLQGVNIRQLGSETGSSSSENGFYKLKLEAGTHQIEFTFVGYKSELRTVHIGDDNNIEMNIEMISSILSMEELVVTASRIPEYMSEIPGRVELIGTKEIQSDAAKSADELLTQTSGVIVDRSMGIFGKSVVSIRGIVGGEQGRILVLQNGIPINKSDGGSVNWNRINVNDIQKIEIFKGPGSSIYGSNAMGGVINILTKKNTEKGTHGYASADFGSFNTFTQNLSIGGRLKDGPTGFYWNISVNNRTSDGYISVPDSLIDETIIATNLEEKGLNAMIGYDFNANNKIEFEYNFYDDARGQGMKIEAEQVREHDTQFLQGKWQGTDGLFSWNLSTFYQLENYTGIREKLKKGNYSQWHIDSERSDMGIFAHGVFDLYKHRISFGGDFKKGKVDGSDIYQTSTDQVHNTGSMNNLALYVQDKYSLNDALKLTAGMRFDAVKFYDGKFDIEGMTGETDFMEDFIGDLDEHNWTAFTPKAAIHYKFSNKINTYIAWSKGFRTPTLDDLSRSGYVSGGFKEANPNLGPETVNSFEWGMNLNLTSKLKIMPGIYFMKGHNFMYYLETGEFIFGGRRPVLRKENITEVQLMGIDLDLKYRCNDQLSFYANYTYTKSEINKFKDQPELEGKMLTYTPENMANAGVHFENKIANFSLTFHYQDKRYRDDANEDVLDSYATVNAKLWKEIEFAKIDWLKSLNVSIDANNLMDKTYLVNYDQISMGRFVSAGISLFF